MRPFHCPRHADTPMIESGRYTESGQPIMHCAMCIKRMRAQLGVLRDISARQHRNGQPIRQVILPPVRMPWV